MSGSKKDKTADAAVAVASANADSSSEDDVFTKVSVLQVRLKQALEATKLDVDRAVDTMRELHGLSINLDLLKKTNIGVTVGRLRKHSNARVQSSALGLVKRWKAIVPASKKRASISQDQATEKAKKPKKEDVVKSDDRQPRRPKPENIDTADGSHSSQDDSLRSPKGFSKSDYFTGDKTRDKIRRMLAESLDLLDSENDRMFVSIQAEHAMFAKFGGSGKDYLNQFRNIVFNLKDVKNVDFRKAVCNGMINPMQLASMTAMEMASSELKQERSERQQWMKDAARSDWNRGQGATDMFTCGRCKTSLCTFYQMQTRSADEPMTVFVTCLNCNNRWKC